VANLFGFKPEGDFFSVPPSVKEVPDVDFAASQPELRATA